MYIPLITANINNEQISELPPLTNGSVTPVSGIILRTPPTVKNTWNAIVTPNPTAISL